MIRKKSPSPHLSFFERVTFRLYLVGEPMIYTMIMRDHYTILVIRLALITSSPLLTIIAVHYYAFSTEKWPRSHKWIRLWTRRTVSLFDVGEYWPSAYPFVLLYEFIYGVDLSKCTLYYFVHAFDFASELFCMKVDFFLMWLKSWITFVIRHLIFHSYLYVYFIVKTFAHQLYEIIFEW